MEGEPFILLYEYDGGALVEERKGASERREREGMSVRREYVCLLSFVASLVSSRFSSSLLLRTFSFFSTLS